MRRASTREIIRAAATFAAGLSLTLLLVWGIVGAVRAQRRQKLPPVEGIALCYAEMCDLGEQLGAARHPRDTPTEYARVLSAAIQSRAARWPWSTQQLLPVQAETASDTTRLSQAYQRASYFPQSVSPQERARIDQLWQRLQRQLRRLALTSRASSGQDQAAR